MRAVASALAVAAVVAGCAGGGEQPIEHGELATLVLQPADLADDYHRFDEGALVRAEAARGIDGWKARYRWEGTPDAPVPLVVESRVDRFESVAAAEEDLRDVRDGLEGELTEAPELGGDAALTTFTRGSVRFFVAAWRKRNVVATLSVNGFDGKVREADVLALARRQADRLAAG